LAEKSAKTHGFYIFFGQTVRQLHALGMKISVLNKTTRVSQVELEIMCQAVTLQAAQFCAEWDRIPAQVVPVTELPAQGAIVILQDVLDNPDLLGIHGEEGGRYIGRVSIQAIMEGEGGVLSGKDGAASVSSVLSHEVLEILGDANGETWVSGPTIEQGSEYALEVADPVQSDHYEIEAIPGVPVQVSSFVLPAWFEKTTTATRLDWLGVLNKPFTVREGGYMIVRSVGEAAGVTAAIRRGPAAPSCRAGCRASRRLGG
jgi:hypothetical protein